MQKYLTTKSGRKILLNTPEEEAQINAGITADPDTPELDDAWFARAKPANEFFDKKTYEGLVELSRRGRGQRGPQKAPTKERVTIRLSHDVVEKFRATGDGWQTRVDDALHDWLKTHHPA